MIKVQIVNFHQFKIKVLLYQVKYIDNYIFDIFWMENIKRRYNLLEYINDLKLWFYNIY
jgi:hypothetical protein